MGLKELFESLANFFRIERMEFAIIGAFSLQAYGYISATRDIDFIVRAGNRKKVIGYLESLGFETLSNSGAFSNHLHPDGNMRVDLMFINGPTADTIFSSTETAAIFGSLSLPTVRPEHLIALKLYAAHSDKSRKYREFADIQELMRRVKVDEEAVKGFFQNYGFGDMYHKLIGK